MKARTSSAKCHNNNKYSQLIGEPLVSVASAELPEASEPLVRPARSTIAPQSMVYKTKSLTEARDLCSLFMLRLFYDMWPLGLPNARDEVSETEAALTATDLPDSQSAP